MLIYVCAFFIFSQTENNLDKVLNISGEITAFVKMLVSIILLLSWKKQNMYKELKLKVTKIYPIDFDCSTVIFENNDKTKYAITTDLDEKFENLFYFAETKKEP